VSAPGSSTRPYESLLAKGEDRKHRILAVAERLLARNGWRNTSLAQIAKEAGVSPAGLLHHFESKEQLLNAVLDARDDDDDTHADRSGDLVTEIGRVAERFRRARCTTACSSGSATRSTSSRS
jgi:AcrR family transcriptional regulator